MDARLSLSLGAVRHGWLEVRLAIGDFVFDDVASNVLNDPLAELVEVERFLVDASIASVRVCLWLEPDGYVVDFDRDDETSSVRVRVGYDESLVPPMRGRTPKRTVLDTRIVATRLAPVLWRALDGFFVSVDADALETWRSANGRTYERTTRLSPAVRRRRAPR